MPPAFPTLTPAVRLRLAGRGIDPERSIREWFLLLGTNPDVLGRETVEEPVPLTRGEYVADPPGSAGSIPGGRTRLTEREIDVIRFICVGDQDAEIAGRLEVTVNTVKAHVKNALAKLQARNRTHLVTRAFQEDVVRCR
jgi:DNA-binding NarL/FixJ family response regulator